MNRRVEWIDVAKFWGMFFIFLGHFATSAGNAYYWVFSFHVPLFFFLSGCLENYNKRSPMGNLGHKALTTLMPFYFFGILSIAYEIINANSIETLMSDLHILLLGGVRNTIKYGGGLWFLSCLFVVQIAFSFLKSIIKSRTIMLLFCLCVYLGAQLLIEPRPIVTPHWFYNLDSACFYMIFYCLGWLTYQLINQLLNETRNAFRTLRTSLTTVSLVYSSMLFFGRDLMAPLVAVHPLFYIFSDLVRPLPSIWIVIVISQLFQSNSQKRIGCHSLYMCGNEYIIKSLVPNVLALVGLQLTISNPLQSYLYTLILLVLTEITLVPLERPLLERLKNAFSTLYKQIFIRKICR